MIRNLFSFVLSASLLFSETLPAFADLPLTPLPVVHTPMPIHNHDVNWQAASFAPNHNLNGQMPIHMQSHHEHLSNIISGHMHHHFIDGQSSSVQHMHHNNFNHAGHLNSGGQAHFHHNVSATGNDQYLSKTFSHIANQNNFASSHVLWGSNHSTHVWSNTTVDNLHQATSINLDLSSSSQSMSASHLLHGNSIIIDIGGKSFVVNSKTMLTPAEYLAAMEVASGSQQSVTLNAMGVATGGTIIIGQHLSHELTSLVIPQGVTVVDISKSGTLNLSGNIVDNGKFYLESTNPNVNAVTVNANNISVQNGGIFSDLIPSGSSFLQHGNNPGLALNLDALNSINNAGSVISGGSLSLQAGSGNITNSGTMISNAGNINIGSTPAQNISIDARGGTFQANNGNINVRDASYTGVSNINLTGGNYLSQNLNLYSRSGAITGNIGQVSGSLNSQAGSEHLYANTANLVLGNNSINGDPLWANTGNLEIDGAITTSGNSLAVIAGGNIITNNSCTINTQAGAVGGNVYLIAGADITAGGGTTSPIINSTSSLSSVTMQFDNSYGGNIDFTAATGSALIKTGGGSVTLLANSDGSGTGNIWFSTSSISIAANNSQAGGGAVTVIAGGTGGTALSGSISAAIQLGQVQTAGATTSAVGNVQIYAAAPTVSGGGSAVFTTNGSGSASTTSTFTPGTITSGGQITVNNINTSGYGGAGTAANVTGGSGGAGGSITIQADRNIAITNNLLAYGGGGGGSGGGLGTTINGGAGGNGGSISVSSNNGSINIGGEVNSSGGGGGGGGGNGIGGTGGTAGILSLTAVNNSVSVTGSILASSGGAGGVDSGGGGGSFGGGGGGAGGWGASETYAGAGGNGAYGGGGGAINSSGPQQGGAGGGFAGGGQGGQYNISEGAGTNGGNGGGTGVYGTTGGAGGNSGTGSAGGTGNNFVAGGGAGGYDPFGVSGTPGISAGVGFAGNAISLNSNYSAGTMTVGNLVGGSVVLTNAGNTIIIDGTVSGHTGVSITATATGPAQITSLYPSDLDLSSTSANLTIPSGSSSSVLIVNTGAKVETTTGSITVNGTTQANPLNAGSYGSSSYSVTINQGSGTLTITPSTLVTPAEWVAAVEVQTGGSLASQTLTVGSSGNATAGNFTIAAANLPSVGFSTINIPAGTSTISGNISVASLETNSMTDNGLLQVSGGQTSIDVTSAGTTSGNLVLAGSGTFTASSGTVTFETAAGSNSLTISNGTNFTVNSSLTINTPQIIVGSSGTSTATLTTNGGGITVQPSLAGTGSLSFTSGGTSSNLNLNGANVSVTSSTGTSIGSNFALGAGTSIGINSGSGNIACASGSLISSPMVTLTSTSGTIGTSPLPVNLATNNLTFNTIGNVVVNDAQAISANNAASTGNDVSITDTADSGISLTQSITAGGTLSLINMGTNSPIALGNSVSGTVVTITATGAGTITQTSGTITGSTSLSLSSVTGSIGPLNIASPNVTFNTSGAVTLSDSTAITSNGVSSGDNISLADTANGGMSIVNTITAAGSLSLINSGFNSSVVLQASVSGTADTITATGTGTISQTAGTVSGSTAIDFGSGSGTITVGNTATPNLTFNTSGDVTIGDATALTGNGVSTGNNVSISDSNNGGMSFNNTITATGTLGLTDTGTNSGIALGANVSGTTDTLTATGSGSVSQPGGTLTGTTLIDFLSNSGNIGTNTPAAQIFIATPNITANTSGSVNLSDSVAIISNGVSTAGNGGFTLSDSAGGGVSLTNNISSTGGEVSVSGGGSVSTASGTTLSGSAVSIGAGGNLNLNGNLVAPGNVNVSAGGLTTVASTSTINSTNGNISFANSGGIGAVTVENDGVIEANDTSGIVGFNAGTINPVVTITGIGSISAGEYINVGNLIASSQSILNPYTVVPLFNNSYSLGNVSITQDSITGVLQVSNLTLPSPTPSNDTNSLTNKYELAFYQLLLEQALQQQLQTNAQNILYEQIGTRIATDYTPWTSYPEQPQTYSLQGGVHIDKIATPGEALFAASAFNANELNAFSRQGIVFGQSSKENFFDLVKGYVLFMPTSHINVQTREGLVQIPRGSAVWIMETGADAAIYDFHDDIHTGTVKVIANGKTFSIAPGMEILLTRDAKANFELLNPGNALGYRNIRSCDLGGGIKAFVNDFSISNGLANVAVIRKLLRSSDPVQRKAASKMLKNAAILADLTGFGYKTLNQ